MNKDFWIPVIFIIAAILYCSTLYGGGYRSVIYG